MHPFALQAPFKACRLTLLAELVLHGHREVVNGIGRMPLAFAGDQGQADQGEASHAKKDRGLVRKHRHMKVILFA